MPIWDGKTERRSNPSDHDSLTRAIAILENHVKNFDNHVVEDNKLRERVEKHAMYIYLAIGGLGVLQFIIRGH